MLDQRRLTRENLKGSKDLDQLYIQQGGNNMQIPNLPPIPTLGSTTTRKRPSSASSHLFLIQPGLREDFLNFFENGLVLVWTPPF